MQNIDAIKSELKLLDEVGVKLFHALSSDVPNSSEFGYFLMHYEQWYSKALSVIKQLTPDRFNDFTILYKNDKRKEITYSSYTLSDALQGVARSSEYGHNFKPKSALLKLGQQRNMIAACYERLDSKLYDIRVVLQSEIFDAEIETAKQLLKNSHIRAAGAICGVVLEAHLSEVAKNHNIPIKKKAPTISDFNDSLKDVIYDVVQWRFIQRLGDIRNYCVHNKEREPTKDEVSDLIYGAEKIIKTIF